jgi:hypothetical protein
MRRRFCDDDLERRPYARLEQVTGKSGAISAPKHGMDVHAGLAIRADGDIPD